jgi:septum formation protein
MNHLLILASQSPRRKQLLEWAEIPFEVIVHDTDESYPASMDAGSVPEFIAQAKALAVLESLPAADRSRPLLAADTVVVLDGDVIGKPKDREDAISILRRLSGREHRVITGVFLHQEGRKISFADTTRVSFHPLTEEQIVFYVDKYKPYDKAGAYAIQEWIGVIGIRSIDGDFYNVMGLPVSRVVQALEGYARVMG